jgi:hypothetical protein
MSEISGVCTAGARHRRACAALLLAIAALGSACASLTYQPKVTVGVSPEQMPLRIEIRDLQDASPEGDRSRALGGTAATASDSLAGALAPNVTDAILENFRSDEVFADVSRRPERTDLIMSGTIRRFYGKANQNAVGWAAALDPFGIGTLLSVLGLPVYSSYGTVDLELTFEVPNGPRVATYSATREFDQSSSIYRSPLVNIGAKVNRAFSEVVSDLRQQMLADRERLLTSEPAAAGGAAPGAVSGTTADGREQPR